MSLFPCTAGWQPGGVLAQLYKVDPASWEHSVENIEIAAEGGEEELERVDADKYYLYPI